MEQFEVESEEEVVVQLPLLGRITKVVTVQFFSIYFQNFFEIHFFLFEIEYSFMFVQNSVEISCKLFERNKM